MKQDNMLLPVLSGITFAVIFGFSFMFTKKGLDILEPIQLLGFRFATAAIVLTLLQIFGVIKVNLQGKKIGILLLLAFFQPVSYFILETLGVSLTSSSEAGMMIALIPVFVTILASIFLKEKPKGIQVFFIIISVAGVMFINLMKGSNISNDSVMGILYLCGAVIAAGFYNILSRKSSFSFNPVEITFVMMWVGALVFNLIALIQFSSRGDINTYLQPLSNPYSLMAIGYLGILSSVVAFFMTNYTLSKIEASQSAVFSNLTTIVSVLAGTVLLGETFYWYHLVGGLMILFGVWGTNYYGKLKSKQNSVSDCQ